MKCIKIYNCGSCHLKEKITDEYYICSNLKTSDKGFNENIKQYLNSYYPSFCKLENLYLEDDGK